MFVQFLNLCFRKRRRGALHHLQYNANINKERKRSFTLLAIQQKRSIDSCYEIVSEMEITKSKKKAFLEIRNNQSQKSRREVQLLA